MKSFLVPGRLYRVKLKFSGISKSKTLEQSLKLGDIVMIINNNISAQEYECADGLVAFSYLIPNGKILYSKYVEEKAVTRFLEEL